jgi:hypothetical protein
VHLYMCTFGCLEGGAAEGSCDALLGDERGV